MSKEELFNKVKDIIADQTGEDASKITMTTNIKDDWTLTVWTFLKL